MNATKQRKPKTHVAVFFKVINPTQHGWMVLDDHLDHDAAEQLAEENPGSFIRFSSYQVQKNRANQPDDDPSLTSENSQVVSVFDVLEIGEYSVETIAASLEYADAVQLQASRKHALVKFSGFRRVLMPPMPEEPRQYRERRADAYNSATSITWRLFTLPLITVMLLAALVILKQVGVL